MQNIQNITHYQYGGPTVKITAFETCNIARISQTYDSQVAREGLVLLKISALHRTWYISLNIIFN